MSEKRRALSLCPVTLREACAWVTEHHRHHDAPTGGLFAVGASDGKGIVGLAIVGRPNARMLEDDFTAEVTRCCTDGTRNCCSMLYRACWRAARAIGYLRLVTYTLPQEGGASLRGAGMKLVGRAGGGTWSRPSRPRVDTHPTQEKIRWEITT